MAPDVSELLLLTAITPGFLSISKYYSKGKDPEALQARRKLSPTTPFYTFLYQDFKKLDEVLKNLPTSHNVSLQGIGVITTLLDYLEKNLSRSLSHSTCNLTENVSAGTEKFPRVLNLQHRIEIREAQDLRRLIRLRNNSSEQFIALLSAIKKCEKHLERHMVQGRLSIPPTYEPTVPKVSSHGRHKLAAYHVKRDYANLIHNLLLQNWKCGCKTPHTTTMFCLTTDVSTCSHEDLQCSCEQARFDLFFCTAAESSLERHLGDATWQHGQIGISHRQRSTRFAGLKGNEEPAEPKTDEQWDKVPGICALLQAAAKTNQCLRIRLRNRELRYRLAGYDECDALERTPEVSRTLAHFLRGDQTPFSFSQVRRRERFALAVILANALLHLYEGPWCVQYWNAAQICFRKGSHPAIPDFRRPYLLTRCDTVEPVTSHPQYFKHPYPGLYSLGCLLLQIELRRPINPDSLQDVSKAMDEATDTRTELGKNFEQYFEAIDACLNIFKFKPGATFQSEEFIDEVYAAIVSPLETVLYESFPYLVDKLSTPAEPLDILNPQTLQSILGTAQAVLPIRAPAAKQTMTTNRIPTTLPILSASFPTRTVHYPRPSEPRITSQMSTREDEYPGVFLHGHVNDSDSLNSENVSEAEEWFAKLKNKVQPIIKGQLVESGTEKIRIAILDTGLELPEDCRFIYSDRIRECRSWLGAVENEDGDPDTGNIDVNGHGTHSTGLLLRVAPNAEVFVARVFENPDEKQSKQTTEATQRRVSRAIRYAVDKWKVHIITMSFGFENVVDIVDDAITYACSQKVLILAAASNCGGNSDLTWPAKSRRVLCIYATTGIGNPYHRNPTQRAHQENFATLGTAVESWWPERLQRPGNRVQKSGTSVSTPIAAGIAAIVMEIVRQPLRIKGLSREKIEKFKQLGTVDGMSAVFRRMVGENGNRQGYSYLAPWETLDRNYSSPTTIVDNILKELS